MTVYFQFIINSSTIFAGWLAVGLIVSHVGNYSRSTVLIALGVVVLPRLLKELQALVMFHKQEKHLGFCFSEEMEKLDIHQKKYQSEEWFIRIEFGRVIAIRKDYIKFFGNIVMQNPWYRPSSLSGQQPSRLDVEMMDGTKMILRYDRNVRDFGKWLGATWDDNT